VAVRHLEGLVHGFLVLRTLEGRLVEEYRRQKNERVKAN
jgi:hypothetical protein